MNEGRYLKPHPFSGNLSTPPPLSSLSLPDKVGNPVYQTWGAHPPTPSSCIPNSLHKHTHTHTKGGTTHTHKERRHLNYTQPQRYMHHLQTNTLSLLWQRHTWQVRINPLCAVALGNRSRAFCSAQRINVFMEKEEERGRFRRNEQLQRESSVYLFIMSTGSQCARLSHRHHLLSKIRVDGRINCINTKFTIFTLSILCSHFSLQKVTF